MAKFRLNANSVFTIGGNTIACVTEVSIDDSVDDYVSRCAGLGTTEHIPGQITVTGSGSFEIEQDAATELGYLAPGTTGALVLRPNGTTSGDLDITSTNLTVLSRSMAFSSTGLSTGSFTFACDDLTIAAIAP